MTSFLSVARFVCRLLILGQYLYACCYDVGSWVFRMREMLSGLTGPTYFPGAFRGVHRLNSSLVFVVEIFRDYPVLMRSTTPSVRVCVYVLRLAACVPFVFVGVITMAFSYPHEFVSFRCLTV